MKRLLTIAVLAFLALAGTGFGAAAAEPAACLPDAALGLDGPVPAAHAEKPSAAPRSRYETGPVYACNSRCANSCRRRFADCRAPHCGRQYQACIRSCGC